MNIPDLLPAPHGPDRLTALRRTMLDIPSGEAFDRLTRLATRVLNVPVSLVSLVAEDRQHFKGCVGLPEPWQSRRETPLSHSFCQHVVATGEPLIVEDAREDARLSRNPAIRDLGVVAYAGIPLCTPDGVVLGSFCAIDHHPRRWTESEISTLRDLAASVLAEMELRAEIAARHAVEEELRQSKESIRSLYEISASPQLDREGKFQALLELGRRRFGLPTGILSRIEGDRFTVEQVRSPSADLCPGLVWDLKDVYCCNAVRDGAPVALEHAGESVWKTHRCYAEMRLEAYIGTPVMVVGELYGTLCFNGPEPKPVAFGAADREFLQLMAQWVGAEIGERRAEETRRRLATEHAARIEAEQAEAMLRDSEAYFRALLENSSDIIQVVDGDGTRRYVSPSVENILGWTPDELIGAPLDRLVHSEDLEEMGVAFRQALARKQSAHVQVRVRHHDGSWRILETVAVDLRHDPAVEGIVVNSRDVTERTIAEEALFESQQQLIQAQKMEAVGRLAGGVAHDFNNLLTAIKGTTALLLLDTPDGDPAREDLREIDEAANRAAGLTQQLLAFSRKQVLEPRVLDLNEGVEQMERMLRRLIGEDVELVTRLAPQLGRVKADPGQIEQILLNLVVNARDAMPTGGRIVIGTVEAELPAEVELRGLPPGPYVCLSVSDTGHGMDEGTRERIFEPFFTTKAQGKGTGLGLSTVYGIVKQSGGGVEVQSTPEAGTTFRIFLPRVEEELAVEPAGIPEVLPEGTETVLLVEDEDAVRSLAERILRRSGYRVLEAPSGDIAQLLYGDDAGEIDLLVTDVVMPGMSGRDLSESLQRLNPELRTLYISGYTDEAMGQHGVEHTRRFLQKPFTPQSLTRKIREVLDA